MEISKHCHRVHYCYDYVYRYHNHCQGTIYLSRDCGGSIICLYLACCHIASEANIEVALMISLTLDKNSTNDILSTIIAASGPLLCAATPVPKQHCVPKHYEIRIDMSKMQLKIRQSTEPI